MSMPVQREALRELSRSGEAYRFLLSERDLAVLVLSEQVEDCNEAACQLFGISREELIGRSPLEFAPPHQPDGLPSDAAARERIVSALAGLPQWCTWQYRRKDGKLVDTLVHAEAVRVDGVRRALIRIRDVSRLQRAEVALAENELRLQQILDNTTTAIVFAKDLAGRYLFVNRAFERIVGLPQREIVGKMTTDLFPPETAAALMANHGSAIARGDTMTVEEEVNIGGRIRTLLTNKFPLFDSQGRPYAICGIAADITERKRTEEALKRASLAVSVAGGMKGFDGLVENLAAVLETDVAFVSVFTDTARNRMRTLAAWLDGRLLRNYEYDLADSPCAGIIGRVFRFVPSGALSEIPAGTMYHAKGMDGYAAYALTDSTGAALGLIAVMNRAPLADGERVEAILKIFAVRAAAELERTRAEEALRSAALAVSVAGGETVFRDLVAALARILEIEMAAIALPKPGDAQMMQMLAFQVDGRVVDQFEYPLAGTPCEAVMGQQYRAYPARLMAQFPLDAGFWGPLESYAGLPLFDAHGNALGIISVMSRRPLPNPDLVESMLKIFAARAVTEIERMRANDALRASEEQYRAIFNASEDALILWDSTLTRVDVNPAYERVYGWKREEVIDRRFEGRRQVPPRYAEPRLELVRRSLAGETCHAELDAIRKNGERFQSEVRTIPIQHRGEPHVLAIARDVTERKRAEEAVRASEEQYRGIFNSSVDGMMLWDAHHQIVDVNQAFLAMHGYSREELVGQSQPVFIPGDFQEKCVHLLPEILAGKPCHIEARGQRKDGSGFDVEIHGVPMQYQGQPHVLVILRDVTDRVRAAERLRQSEERYRQLFEMESDAILLVDVETLDLIDVNRAAEELYGWTRDELLRLKATDISVEVADTQATIQRHTGTLRIPLRHHRRKDGSVFQVEISSNLLELDGRKVLLAAIRDITERRRAEEMLRESEQRYRMLFEMESDAIVVVDVQTLQHLDANRAAVELYGYSREELLALKSTDLSAEPADTSAAMRAGSKQSTGVVKVPLRHHRKKDGTVFPVDITANFFELDGHPIMVAAIRDITERRMREEERARLEAQLRQAQKMEAIGHLTGGIAHDFNNLLTSILGYIVLGTERQEALGDAKLGKYLDQAQRAAQRARDLIQQMLTFSRGQRGERRALALAPLVTESVKLLRSSLPATVELETEISAGVPRVMSDPVQLEQVLLNLCINARDAMNGTGQIRVGVRQDEFSDAVCASCRQKISGQFVELAVADGGTGIAPDVLDRMFEPFFTTKEVGRGSGMGLAMVHGIVHDHGGHIVVDTEPGRGTTFRLLFAPVAETSAERGAPEADASAPRKQRPRLAGRVLVVEDEEMVGDFMSEMLANWGLDVTVKRAPIEAEVWYAHDPSRVDLVITDQTMPRLTGVELARRLTGVRPDLPVILYTGYSDAVNDEAMARSGICALLRKPVDADRLLALLRAHLPGARQPPAAASTARPEPVPARKRAPAKRAHGSTGKSATRKRTVNGRRAAR
jgi:PAS domain S-box-containing protein